MQTRPRRRRRAAVAVLSGGIALLLGSLLAPVSATATNAPDAPRDRVTTSAHRVDVRKRQGLFVDPYMPAAQQGPAYRAIASRAQALWFDSGYYPTATVRDTARAYVSRAVKAHKTPMVVVYSLPGRDCGQYSAGGAANGKAYRAWINHLAAGLKDSKAMVVLEPDAIGHYTTAGLDCPKKAAWPGLMRYASRKLTKVGAWVYLDAAHSDWRPYDRRASLLKKAGVAYARGFSTNVANYRPLSDEKAYAAELIRQLKALKVTGVHYVVDTSRNGNPHPVNGDVTNPTWARVGAAPKLVFRGAFDGTLWVKHPGESDGDVNGGGPSGQWCDLLADRLLGRTQVSSGC